MWDCIAQPLGFGCREVSPRLGEPVGPARPAADDLVAVDGNDAVAVPPVKSGATHLDAINRDNRECHEQL